jgi:septum formation protein
LRIILASASPRRAQILRDAGIEFEARLAEVEESQRPGEAAEAMVQRLAENKATAGAIGVAGEALVIGADTVVVSEGVVWGKPADTADARRMLEKLSGRTHKVVTGIALLRLPDRTLRNELETTRVSLAPLSELEIEEYVLSGEPLDKAGGYAIQGRAGRFVTRIEGCYFNVVGLPLARLYGMLAELGWSAAGTQARISARK